MELRQIEHFCMVCDTKKISAAARTLGFSEQALSKSIKKLENELGIQLFVRTPHGIILTSEAEKLYDYARNVISDVESLKACAQDLKLGRNKYNISLGCYEQFLGDESSPMSIRLLFEFFNKQPDLRVELFEGYNDQIAYRVSHEMLDLGIYIGEVPADLESFYLTTAQTCAVVSKKNPLAKKKKLTCKDLDAQTIIFLHGKRDLARELTYLCDIEGVTPILGTMELNRSAAYQLVYANIGIMFDDRRNKLKIDSRKAVMLPMDNSSTFFNPPVSVIWRRGFQLTSAHKRLIKVIKKRVDERSGEVELSFDD